MTALTGVPSRSNFATLSGGYELPAPDPARLDPVEAAALAAALEEIPTAAFVVWEDGRIALGNRPGEAASERTPAFVASGLLASLRGRGNAFRVTPIPAPGAPAHFLAVQVGGFVDPGPRLAAAAASLHLTPRQAQVLGLLALGRTNKAISSELGCAESTVEIHVTAVLAKSGCGGRTEVVARFWSEPIGSARPVRQGALRRNSLGMA